MSRQEPVLVLFEDVHWADPTSLEALSRVIDQAQDARVLVVLTYRPEFEPPWSGSSHVTTYTLNRLSRRQTATLIEQVTGGKGLPAEVREQIVAKTDGIPLFVEELTKHVLESGWLVDNGVSYALTVPLPPLAIPTTLHDSLMARLDRLAAVKGLAQLAATLGREFSYELLQAVAPWDEASLRQGLHQLVEAEFLYQRGLPPQATYVFKHALIQEAAYQSFLRSTRQQHHQHIAQVVEQRFPELCAMQPEVLAQAIPYWQRAGQRAIERSANVEAVAHLTKGLELLATLPDTPEHVQQELVMQTTLGPALMTTKGFATPEVERVYTRARALCRQVGETPQLFPVLWGLWLFYEVGGEVQTARELAEQLLSLAQRQQDPALLLSAYRAMGQTVYWQGELVQARAYLEQGIALYDPKRHRSLVFHYSQDAGVGLRTFVAHVLWYLGYPEQAAARLQEALTLARELSHPFSLALALDHAAWLYQYRREERLAQEQAEADMALSREQGFAFFLAHGTFFRGWALAAQGQRTEGITQMHQGLDALRTRGVGVLLPRIHTLLAEAYGESGQAEEGLRLLAEALATADHQGMHLWEPELYRVKGELLLRQSVPDAPEAERCFRQALDSARHQEAKSLELRAATSLSRLWQRQGRRAEARQLLAPIYGWFTEGFETVDLKEAKALLEELSA